MEEGEGRRAHSRHPVRGLWVKKGRAEAPHSVMEFFVWQL
jgi:hypothetical protein